MKNSRIVCTCLKNICVGNDSLVCFKNCSLFLCFFGRKVVYLYMCCSHQFSLSGFEEQQFAFVRKAGLVCMCLKEQQFCSGQQLSLYVFGRFQAY